MRLLALYAAAFSDVLTLLRLPSPRAHKGKQKAVETSATGDFSWLFSDVRRAPSRHACAHLG